MIESIEIVLTIILVMLIGVFAAHKKWILNDGVYTIAKLITNIALPCNMIAKIASVYTRAELVDQKFLLLIPFLSILCCYMAGIFFAHLLNVPNTRRGAFIAMFCISSAVFMGIPVNIALFGENNDTLSMVYVYYISNSFFNWTLAINGMQYDGTPSLKRRYGFNLKNFKRLLNGGFVGLVTALSLVLLGFQWSNYPQLKFLHRALEYVGSLIIPLPLILMGALIYNTNWKKFKFTKDMLVLIFGRFVISPFMVVLISYLLQFCLSPSKIAIDIFVVQASMPAISQMPLLAKIYGSDAEYAAIMTSLTTILMVLFLPITKMLLG